MNRNLLRPFRKELIEYCNENKLQFEKIAKFPKCGNDNILAVQYHNHLLGKDGMKDNKPAEIIILAERTESGEVVITPGKNINKYLG